MGVVFKPEELKEAIKEFRGVIVDADYGDTPFGLQGRPDIERRKQLAIKIVSDEYDKPQYEWYVPTNRKKTKWAYFIEALAKTGALKDVVITGSTDEERIMSFAKSLIGMEFYWVEQEVELLVKGKTTTVLLPEVYYGKKQIEPVSEIKTEKVEL